MGHGDVEVTVISLNKPQKYKGWHKFKKWIILRNKMLAAIMGGIVFFAIFGYVIYDVLQDPGDAAKNIVYDCPQGITPDQHIFIAKSNNQTLSTCYWVQNDYCSIFCSGAFESVNILMHDLINNDLNCITNLSLTFSGMEFPLNSLAKDWFESSAKIQFLNIIDSPNLSIIETGAFNGPSFSTTKQLKLENLNISHLTENIFEGLSALKGLHIAKMPLNSIDALLLDAVPGLAELSLEEIPRSMDLKNLTGSSKLKSLQIVSLRHNQLPNTISSNTFSSLEAVVSLYLSDSKIEWIGVRSFDVVSQTVQTIDLQGNQLKTLPFGLFDTLTISTQWSVFLGLNEWKCNCSLVQLQQYLIDHTDHFLGNITCSDEMSGISVANAELGDCMGHDLSTTEQEDVIEITSDSIDAESLATIKSIIVSTVNCSFQHTTKSSTQIRVRSKRHSLKITSKPDDGYVSVETDPALPITMNLIWFEQDSDEMSSISSEAYCMTNLTQIPMHIHNLTTNRAYVFCLIEETAITVSPFDCAAYYFNYTNVERQISQPENSRLPTILMTLVSATIALLIGLLIGTFLLRKCYAIESRNFKHPGIAQPNISCTSGKCSRHATFSNIKFARPIYHRSISDSSIHSFPSYVTAIRPSAHDLVQWQKQTKIYEDALNLQQFPNEVPPCLPHFSGLECSACGCPNVAKVNRRTIFRQDNVSDHSSYA